jgi:hypothetical protein
LDAEDEEEVELDEDDEAILSEGNWRRRAGRERGRFWKMYTMI